MPSGRVQENDSTYNYEIEFREIIKDLSPLFFNLNSSINFSGVESLRFHSEVKFSREEINEFLQLVARLTSGGKFPVQVEVSRYNKLDLESMQ